jgi:hypothetical protein
MLITAGHRYKIALTNFPVIKFDSKAFTFVLRSKALHIERHKGDYSTDSTAKSRTSTKWPAMAAAAAMTGLTRWVRLSLP